MYARRPAAGTLVATSAALLLFGGVGRLEAQSTSPSMTVPNLSVRTALGGLMTPIGLAFLSDTEWLVIEKNTGQVRLVEDGVIGATALDLAVNNFSERGLLGIALHPDFEEPLRLPLLELQGPTASGR